MVSWASHIYKGTSVSFAHLTALFHWFLFGSGMRVVTNGVSVVLDFSVPIFHFPASRWKESPPLPWPSRAARAPMYPGARNLWDCRAGLLLLSGCTDVQHLQTSALPRWRVSIYLVNSWAVFKVHYLNLESSWDSPTGPLWCSSSTPYKDEPVTNYCSLVITPAWCNIWWHLLAGYKNRNTKYDLLQTIY